MEIIFDRSQMLKAVNVAKGFAESASATKVLQGVFLSAESGRVRLVTTDLSLWCQVKLDARVADAGTLVVPVRTLGTVLKTLPHSRVTLREEGDDALLAAGTSEVRIAGLDAEGFPDVEPPRERRAAMPLPASLVNKVAYAVSNDETRYTLNGVHVEAGAAGLKLVATDGHRLARYAVPSLPPGSVLDAGVEEAVAGIVPARLLCAGARLGSQLGRTATLELYEKSACMRVNGSLMLWADLIEGKYPEYEGIIPSAYSGSVTVSSSVLGSAVSRLVALCKGCRVGRVRLAVEGGELVLKVEGDALGVSAVERLVPSSIEGTVPVCGFNVRYLAEALERLPDAGRAQLKFSDAAGESPVAVESTDCPGLVALVMPTQL